MDALPNFSVVNAASLDDVLKVRAENPDARLLGGGTDLVVNIRRGIVAAPVLIDVTRVDALRGITADADRLEVGASVTLAELAEHPDVIRHYPVVAQAAGSIAGPTHRNMGTVGGNLCLDTRCIYYNQSDWWRGSVKHCLKTTGDICHVASDHGDEDHVHARPLPAPRCWRAGTPAGAAIVGTPGLSYDLASRTEPTP